MNLKPHHVGISIADMTASIDWYKTNLGFELLWQKDFSDIKTKIAFLKNGDFQIELFEHYQTQILAEHRKQPLTDIQHQGTKHICFILENGIEAFYERLVAGGVDVAMSLRESPPKDAFMCFIRDNTGNLIEIIQVLS
jgi:catechol 2,3-dioxygenase-like lactoylglutathione lyase family enzyme